MYVYYYICVCEGNSVYCYKELARKWNREKKKN